MELWFPVSASKGTLCWETPLEKSERMVNCWVFLDHFFFLSKDPFSCRHLLPFNIQTGSLVSNAFLLSLVSLGLFKIKIKTQSTFGAGLSLSRDLSLLSPSPLKQGQAAASDLPEQIQRRRILRGRRLRLVTLLVPHQPQHEKRERLERGLHTPPPATDPHFGKQAQVTVAFIYPLLPPQINPGSRLLTLCTSLVAMGT